MMAEFTDFVVIDGHKVRSDRTDQFYSGKDGTRVTDEEWDISKAKIEAAEALEGDEAITWEIL